MSQTILIETDSELSKVFSINLQTYTGTDIIVQNNSTEAIELIKILPSINLIICRDKVNNHPCAINIFKFLRDHQLDIPMIVLGESIELASEVLQLKIPISWEILVRHASLLLGVSGDIQSERVKPSYVPISINYFYDIKSTPCDVYIRIKKTNTEFQFVKRLHSQDNFTSDDIDNYKEQGLSNLYVPKDYIQYFVTFVTNSIVTRLETDLDLSSRLKTNANAHEIVKEHISKAGVTPEIAELSDNNIASMVKAVEDSPKLASLLKFLFTSKISYAYQKAHLVCVVGNFIMSKQSWYEKRHLDTFTRLSFFADITLKSSKQMKINTNQELNDSDLTEEEKEEVRVHARAASKIAKDFPKSDEYIEVVTMQHQGAMNGIGLPDTPSPDLHPIAKVFVVSDAFVKTMLNPHDSKSKREILTVLYMQFPSSSYQKIIKVLEQKIE
jgi:hypothetical protein